MKQVEHMHLDYRICGALLGLLEQKTNEAKKLKAAGNSFVSLMALLPWTMGIRNGSVCLYILREQ